jgi:hypothetical protein
MSSPKAALAKKPVAKAAVSKATRRPKAAARATVSAGEPGNATADAAQRLAADIERELVAGRTLSPEALQALMAALCRSYATQAETDPGALPLQARGAVSNTDIMLMASALLRSANLAVFELGMWQSWTGR